jgi:sulfur-carrier protein adenylyltransferase/sulfurtransferase
MITWNTIFERQQEISTEETSRLVRAQQPGSIQLLDVRQPSEYREFHLPGATLIPLGSLAERLDELDPARETIVYCRSGARSNAACQILRSAGYSKVLNMSGGMLSWQGETAVGGEKQGLDYFLAGSYANAISMAYSMEAGMEQFYLILAKRSQTPRIAQLLEEMADFEKGHIARLAAQYRKEGGELTLAASPPIPEGGLTMEDLWSAFGQQVQTPAEVVQLAMGFEAQAYDLYSRLARTGKDPDLRLFAEKMAGEEQKHLNRLSEELDLLLEQVTEGS